jgi:serine/threonine protein kinase
MPRGIALFISFTRRPPINQFIQAARWREDCMNSSQDLESIFFAAAAKTCADERAHYLHTACAGDGLLLRRVEKMLHAHAEAGSFLEQPAVLISEPLEPAPSAEKAGSAIGPYQLLELIGEGGMGTVWRSQQTEPVRREVALKLIRAGMDSGQVIARFEAERRALALMDHPNIARVLDADTTESGLPYFVMELVLGLQITRYCDEQRLSPRQRIELFVPVCQAIQHAHQKGIIHRDIKPGNVLVAIVDEQPIPKVIDFGVAKAIEPRVGEVEHATQRGVIVGTLEYMSPEQAELGTADIDTRSDVYSLGVLLFELLCGSTPFASRSHAGTPYSEMLRILREEEPQHPSARLVESGEQLAEICERRNSDPAKLKKLLRGELGWIVMKALEKSRERRYESASALALDLKRYLADAPVSACPPSAAYQLRKIVSRHRHAAGLLGGLVLLTTAVASAGWLYSEWQSEAQRAQGNVEHARQVAQAHASVRHVQEAIRQGRHASAFDLLQSIQALLPDDETLNNLLEQCSQTCSISTNPPGADVWIRPYEQQDAAWQHVTQSDEQPTKLRIARGEYLWRATKPGFHEVLGLRAVDDARFTLLALTSTPSNMVRVDAGRPDRPGMAFTAAFPSVDLAAFLIDQHEVTNAEFEQFVRSGGYENARYWSDMPFADLAGNPATWEQIRAQLIDASGRPGPATWRDGSYLPGESDLPVRGVSWYEAAA